jgi:signal transduction histidine kinase
MVDADGQPIGIVGVVRDLSEEKRLQQQKSRFVSYASHELRTPLTNLKTYLYLIGRRPDQLPHYLPILKDVTDWMQRLTDDMLSLAQFESGTIQLKRQRMSLLALVRRGVELQRAEAEKKHQTIITDLPGQAVDIFADEDRIFQVVMNLLINAINYTLDGGTITVRVLPRGERVWLEVRDTGVGISPEDLQIIFQPFYRAPASTGSAKGAGLGLTICQEIVRLHGGEINARSQMGAGSLFTVVLPMFPVS